MKQKLILSVFALFLCAGANAQVNSGSTGSDGALDFSSINYTTNIVINMADHPNGIYNYSYVTIPTNVTVTFISNAANSPVAWLVQSNVVINGTVDVSGQTAPSLNQAGPGGLGGPGGYAGGTGGQFASNGQGPGGGLASSGGEPAAFGTFPYSSGYYPTPVTNGSAPYGNQYLVPIIGGSGGGGDIRIYSVSGSGYGNGCGGGGGGGGGAILIAASQSIQFGGGNILANGGGPAAVYAPSGTVAADGGSGSGGGIRLVSTQITGIAHISASGTGWSGGTSGNGRVRIDTYANSFGGTVVGALTQGSQFVIIPVAGQGAQLTVTGVGGVPVSASPTGILTTPDAVLSPQQNNPIPVIVSCVNLPLNTLITVSVKPANGAGVSATGYNNTGTLAASTATISIVMPRGGGLIYATATTSN